jgi:NitT/TauT family transport system substrate-binding protein
MKYVQQRPDVTQDVMKALIEGIWAFKADGELGTKVLEKYTRVQDRRILDETYDFYSRVLLDVPRTAEPGLRNIFDALSETQPKARTATPKEFFDPKFITQLEKDGFFKQLSARYRSAAR